MPVRNTDSWMTMNTIERRRRAERLAHADLLRALLDRDHHDVRHADDAGSEGAEPDHDDEHRDHPEHLLRTAGSCSTLFWTRTACLSSGEKLWRSASWPTISSIDRLASPRARVANGEREHAEVVGAVERELRGRHRDVDLALLLGAALVA